MPKDRQPVILTTTSDHLSRAAEAVLKRFPKGARPDKNAILNDLASALKPGKNWGGLLADARSQTRTTRIPDREHPRSLQIPARPPKGTAISTHVGAVERRLAGAQGVIDTAVFASAIGHAATEDLIEDAFLAGIIVDISEEQGGYAVLPITTLLFVRDGLPYTIHHNRIEASLELSALILEVLQEVWLTDWSDLLHAEGISMAKVIIGPQRGAAVVPFETSAMVKNRQDVGELDAEAVRFIVPEENYDSGDTDLLISLAELTLPALVGAETELVQIRLAGRNPGPGTWMPVEENIPAPPWSQDYIIRTSNGDWVSAEDDPIGSGMTLSHLLGEALAFVLDYHGIPFQESLYIEASAREMSPQHRTRQFGDNWRILSWRDGRLGEWRLGDPARHARLRRQLESWLVSERSEIKAAEDLPKKAIRVLSTRSSHRNTNHWKRAVEQFRQIA